MKNGNIKLPARAVISFLLIIFIEPIEGIGVYFDQEKQVIKVYPFIREVGYTILSRKNGPSGFSLLR